MFACNYRKNFYYWSAEGGDRVSGYADDVSMPDDDGNEKAKREREQRGSKRWWCDRTLRLQWLHSIGMPTIASQFSQETMTKCSTRVLTIHTNTDEERKERLMCAHTYEFQRIETSNQRREIYFHITTALKLYILHFGLNAGLSRNAASSKWKYDE